MSAFETQTQAPPQSAPRDAITVGKTAVLSASGKDAAIFTMTLGGETIDLLPLRNWGQLDVHKWGPRGKLPGTPAGLEITFDHVKVAGETVLTNDPAGRLKLQRLLNDWLALEKGSFMLAQKKAQPKPAHLDREASQRPENLLPRFQVEVDTKGQVHVNCLLGKEMLATIGLNLPGFSSLINQGLMHKPHSLKVGALHDWVELDGELCSFEKGSNAASKLEKALNERYLSSAALGQGKDVVVFPNAASSTGFDIQFAAKVGGTATRQRRPLDEETLVLLQDPNKCGLLPKDLVIKLSRPNLIFKRKTPDGGERYLNQRPENTINVVGDDGELTIIDLSKPVNYLHLSAVELTAVFNHPAINQHGKVAPQPSRPSEQPEPPQVSVPPSAPPPPTAPRVTVPPSTIATKPVAAPEPPPDVIRPVEPAGPVIPTPGVDRPVAQAAQVISPSPNAWLQAILGRRSAPHELFACLAYSKMAEHIGNSNEGYFGPIPCWACSLGEVEDIADPAFRGVFLTQKGGLGYLNQGHLARFRNEVAFIGNLEATIEGIGVALAALATDLEQRIVFIVTEGYRTKFGVPEQTVVQELACLRTFGALVMSVKEVLQSTETLEVVWTVPAEQEDPSDPQALESLRPDSPAACSEQISECSTAASDMVERQGSGPLL
jgi:hypothetical protein